MARGRIREKQRLRTRKDLLRAAGELLRAGRRPTMEEVAEQAMVSRATAYRYFPNLEALLVEAPLDGETPTADGIFGPGAPEDPEERIDRAEAALHAMVYRNEEQLRLMLAQTVAAPKAGGGRGKGSRIRQNRRSELIEAALGPVRKEFGAREYERLSAALALILGTESMIVLRDVVPKSPAKAREIKSWAVQALVRSALEEARRGGLGR